jgi:NAD(P)-dependent dehydrogenase (short-subunit alcohol dehydrogenase family)
MAKTWFVTGASRGIGRELVDQLLRRGDRVAATLRRPEELADLQATYGDRLWVRALDVTDTGQLRAVIGEAFGAHDRIDVVVSNAGYGVFGTAEDVTDEQIDRIIATNLTGSIQLARAAVPHLRGQGGGLLMQLSSMAGQMTFPAFSMYHATKWGIEGFYDALAPEVEPFGIRTMLVEPGMVRTSFYASATRVPVSAPYRGGPADHGPIPLDEMTGSQTNSVTAMIRAAERDDPPRRLVLGSDAWQLITAALRQRLADAESQRDNAATADVDIGARD